MLEHLNDHEGISTAEAEKAQKQYLELLCNKDFMAMAAKFDVHTDRVDDFWAEILDSASTVSKHAPSKNADFVLVSC